MIIKQSYLNFLAVTAFLSIILCLGGSIYYLEQAIQTEQHAVTRQAQFTQLGHNLAAVSDYLTNETRKFVVTTDRKHLHNYWNEIELTQTRERVLTSLQQLNAPQSKELESLLFAKQSSDVLVATETRAMRLVLEVLKVPKSAMPPKVAAWKLSIEDQVLSSDAKLNVAREIMFAPQYDVNKSIILSPIATFQRMINTQIARKVQMARQKMTYAINFLMILTIVLTLSIIMIFWVFHTQLNHPITKYIQHLQASEANNGLLVPTGTKELRLLAETVNQQTQRNQQQLHENKKFIEKNTQFLQQLAKGDLCLPSQAGSRPIQAALETALTSLNGSLSQTTTAAQNLAQAVTEIQAMSYHLASGTEQRATVVEEGLTTLQQIDTQVKNNVEQAHAAKQIVGNTTEAAYFGQHKMKEMIQAMNALVKASQQMSKIIKSINDIAFQTNLLSSSAAVEATRAGKYGRNFAIIAQGIRSLAERSALTAKETEVLIEDIRHQMQEGSLLVHETAIALGDIVLNVKQAHNSVAEIITATEKPVVALSRLKTTMQQTREVVSTECEQIHKMTSMADELNESAKLLCEEMARFKLRQ
jgi:methyl-accepting chemotaxis protein